MKKLIFLIVLIFPVLALSQWTPWGLQLIQKPNLQSGQIYLGIVNFRAGSNVTFTPFGINTFSINATGGSGGGGTNVCLACLTNGQSGVTLSGSFSGTLSGTGTGITGLSSNNFGTGKINPNNIFPAISGGVGSGTVSNFSAGNISPLFNSSVANPTTFPALTFAQISQAQNLSFASPDGSSGNPSFRALTVGDIPRLMNQTNLNLWNDGSSPSFLAIETPTGIGPVIYDNNQITPISSWSGTNFQILGDVISIGGRWRGRLATNNPNDGYFLIATGNDFKWVSNSVSTGTGLTNALSVFSTNNGVVSSTASNIHFWAGTNVTITATNRDPGNVDITIAGVGGGGTGSGVTNAVSNVSSNNTTVSSTATNIHFWASQSTSLSVTNRDSGNVDIVYGTPSGGSTVGIDYQEQDVTAYANGTNFLIDFSIPSQRWYGTNFALRYSTNWPNNSTSRVVNIFIPPTNFTRRVWVYDAATNWQTAGLNTATLLSANQGAIIRANIFTQGETNVFATVVTGQSVSSGWENFFNPLGIPGLVLWLDAGRGLWQDTAATIAVTNNGNSIRRWDDQSGTGNFITNSGSANTWVQFGAPNSNPAVSFNTSPSWYKTSLSNAITQPFSYFVVYARSVTNTAQTLIDTKNSSGNVGTLGITAAGSYSVGSLAINGTLTINYQLIDTLENSTSSSITTNSVLMTSGNAGVTAPIGFTIGATGVPNVLFTGKIAEILVYNTILTSQNRTDIRNYLTTKYGPF